MIKKLAIIAALLLITGVFYVLFRQISESFQAAKRLDTEVETLTKLQKKNSDLKKRLAEVGTTRFIESQARDKLNMSREGETVVIIPQDELNKVLGVWEEKKEEVLPYWQGWVKLFLH